MLSILPSELKGELRTALESLEVERIFAAIHQVDAYDHELNKLLSNLAQNFDYPSILNALRLNGL